MSVNCKGQLGTITDIYSLAISLNIAPLTKRGKPKAARTLCREINAKYDEVAWSVRSASIPIFDKEKNRWAVFVHWQYFEEPTLEPTYNVLNLRSMGKPYIENGNEVVDVDWLGTDVQTTERVSDMKMQFPTAFSAFTAEQTETEAENTNNSAEVESKEETGSDYEASEQAQSEKTSCPATLGKRVWNQETAIGRKSAQPGYDGIDTSALRLDEKTKRLKPANRVLDGWWMRNADDDVAKLIHVDNPGGGDCMYYALAPMIRALKPDLFENIPPNDPVGEMLRLRKLIAAQVPSAADADGVQNYANLVTSIDLQQPRAKLYQRNFGIPKAAKTMQERRDAVENKRPKLQQRMLQSRHYGTFADLQLLQSIVGPDFALIIFEKNVDFGAPFVCYTINEVVKAAYEDKEIVYVFLLHGDEHFTRLQLRDGQFAFRWHELNDKLPQIANLLKNNCFLDELNAAMMVSQMVDDFVDDYPDLSTVPYAKIGADGKLSNKFDVVVARLLQIEGRKQGEGVEAHVTLIAKEPQLAQYNRLLASEQKQLRDRLASPAEVAGFIQSDDAVEPSVR